MNSADMQNGGLPQHLLDGFPAPGSPDPSRGSITRAVRKRLWSGVLVFLLAAAGAIGLVCWRLKPSYRSEALIRVNRVRPRILYSIAENAPRASYVAYFQTQMAMVTRRTLLNTCLDRNPDLREVPLFEGADDAAQARVLEEAIAVDRVGRTEMFSVAIVGAKPRGLKRLVDALVTTYEEMSKKAEDASQLDTASLLEEQLKEARDDVRDQAQVVESARNNMASSGALPGFGTIDPFAVVYGKLLDVRLKKEELTSNIKLLQGRKPDAAVPQRLVTDALEQDEDVRTLRQSRDFIARMLLSAETELAAPSAMEVEERVGSDVQVTSLKDELATNESLLLWLSSFDDEAKGAPAARLTPPMPRERIVAALDHDPETQHLVSRCLALRGALTTAALGPDLPTPLEIQRAVDETPEVREIKGEIARLEVESAAYSQFRKPAHPWRPSVKSKLDGLRSRLAELEADVKRRLLGSVGQEQGEFSVQQTKALEERLRAVEDQIRARRAEAVKKTEAIVERLRKSLSERKGKVRAEAIAELTEQKKRRMEQRKEALRKQRDLIGGRIKRIRDEIRDDVEKRVKEELTEADGRKLVELERELSACEENERVLKEQLDKQEKLRAANFNNEAALQSAQERLSRAQETVLGIEKRLHEIEVESRAPGFVRVVSYGTEPDLVPYVARRIKYGIVGVIGAAGLALLAMILLERADDRVWSAEDLEQVGGPGILGSLSVCDHRLLRAPGAAALVCVSAPQSVVAEEMRNLMTHIVHPADGDPARTVLITGSGPGDGRTTVAVNLAVCLARSGSSVVLVDANLRKPDVARILRIANAPGLSEVLSGTASHSETIRDTVISSLYVLPAGILPSDRPEMRESPDVDSPVEQDGSLLPALRAGVPPSQGAELLGTSNMADLIEQLGSEFDHVIVDSPPLALSDARVIAPMFDGVLCCLRARSTRRATVAQALDTLRNLGARVLGVALVGVSPRFNGHAAMSRAIDAYSDGGNGRLEQTFWVEPSEPGSASGGPSES